MRRTSSSKPPTILPWFPQQTKSTQTVFDGPINFDLRALNARTMFAYLPNRQLNEEIWSGINQSIEVEWIQAAYQPAWSHWVVLNQRFRLLSLKSVLIVRIFISQFANSHKMQSKLWTILSDFVNDICWHKASTLRCHTATESSRSKFESVKNEVKSSPDEGSIPAASIETGLNFHFKSVFSCWNFGRQFGSVQNQTRRQEFLVF